MKKSIVFLLLFLIHKTQNTSPNELLYDPSDNVDILDINNFKAQVENSPTAWLVKFYLSWCGDCRRLSQKWKKFGSEITQWTDLVKVGAISCSDPENTQICMDFNISVYPSVKYFPEYYQMRNDNLGTTLISGEQLNVNEIKTRVIRRITSEISEGRGQMFPNLRSYQHRDLTKLFDGVTQNVKYVFLVVEGQDGYLGAEVAIDLHKTSNIVVKYSLYNNSELSTTLEIEQFPTLLIFDQNNSSKKITEKIDTKVKLKEAIRLFLRSNDIEIIEEVPKKKYQINNVDRNLINQQNLRLKIKNMGDIIFQRDLEAALIYSLKQEISVKKTLKRERLEALKAYLAIIKKYFPFGYKSLSLIKDLIKLTSNTEEVKGEEVQKLTIQAQRNNRFSSSWGFIGCQGSASGYRRYPCSLWRLFHYLTVNAALQNMENANPREVLDAMHGYMKYFFSCGGCSKHFQKMAIERNMTSVSSLEESVLWLWEAHNIVNERLKRDITEDPMYPKEKFPPKVKCAECYREDGSWERSEVLMYLKRMYRWDNVRYIGSDTRVLFPGLEDSF